MKIHEYQAKEILQRYGIPIPEYAVIFSIEELEKVMREKNWEKVVLKAQIHAGGRGKGGGVQFANNLNEAIEKAKELLGKKIVTPQTDSEGLVCHCLMISPPAKIEKENYLAMTIDREKGEVILIASPMGGMDVEEVAQEHSKKILILPLPQEKKFRQYHFFRIAKLMGWSGKISKQGIAIIQALTHAFFETDASLIEINPLILNEKNEFFALDTKLEIDDNALFRQPFLKRFFDPSQMNPNEAQAQKLDLAYVSLNGSIGCMVNGAGLAMATMDLIDFFGGKPANFLDVGGGASKEKIVEGFKVILSDPKVKVILVNIFGGIMNCALLASGIIEAKRELNNDIPLIVRMEGTEVEQGRKILKEAHLNIITAEDLREAAMQAVKRSLCQY